MVYVYKKIKYVWCVYFSPSPTHTIMYYKTKIYFVCRFFHYNKCVIVYFEILSNE